MRSQLKAASCIVLATTLLASCGRDVAWHDARERGEPLLRRAAARAAEGDTEYAIELYRKALDADARMARAHLDLAILLHDVKADYIPAMYHYQRYLDLRPRTEKQALIENRARLARQSFAAQVAPQSADLAVQRELAQLRKEHDELKTRHAALEHELALHRRRLAAAEGSASPSAPATHTVRPGETLTHIAQYYGVEVKDMVALNNLANANAIRAGQALKLPLTTVTD